MGRASQPAWDKARAVIDASSSCPSPGLVFDRWLPTWTADWKKEEGLPALKEFVERFKNLREEGRKALLSHHARLDTALADSGRPTWSGELVLVAPLCLGLGASHPIENGFTFDATLGVPWIPGSALKGVTRAWARAAGWTDTRIAQLFGPSADDVKAGGSASQGAVVFFGAWPVAGQPLLDVEIVNNHLPEWYAWRRTRAAGVKGEGRAPVYDENPVPVFMLAVPDGARFRFRLAASATGSEADVAAVRGLLEDAVYWLGVGGRTAVGFGTFRRPQEDPARRTLPAAAATHDVWMDVDGALPNMTGGTVYSDHGPRTRFDGGIRVGADWRAIHAGVASLVTGLGGIDRVSGLRISGLLPLPTAFALGFRLGSWRGVTLTGAGPGGEPYTIDPEVGDTPYFEEPTWSVQDSGEFGTLVLHASTMGRRFDPESLPGVEPLAVGELVVNQLFGPEHGHAAQEQLRAFFREGLRRFPRYDRVVFTLDAPWTLAVLAGRAVNPNVVRRVEVPNFERGQYEAAFVYPEEGR